MRLFVSLLLFLCTATGVYSASVTTTNPLRKVKENDGVDLTCTPTADFGSDYKIQWKFDNAKGDQKLVFIDGQPTRPYADRVTLYSQSNLRFSKVTRHDNGDYTCSVSNFDGLSASVVVKLIVLVPPSVPQCVIPATVTTKMPAKLSCRDPDSSPPPTYSWYKDETLLPLNPNQISGFKNSTYKLDANTGDLVFDSATNMDTGKYYCEIVNEAGPAQRCLGGRMEVRDLNTGGIVAGVLIALLLVALLIGGVWYANKKGYLSKLTRSKQQNSVYQPASKSGGGEIDDGEFKQKSSFVV